MFPLPPTFRRQPSRRRAAAFSLALLLLLPLAAATATSDTRSASSSECLLATFETNLASCWVSITATVTLLNGCARDICEYEVEAAATGVGSRFGLLGIEVMSMSGGSLCPTPVGNDPLRPSGICRRVCESITTGAIVECHDRVRWESDVPAGYCLLLWTDAKLSYYTTMMTATSGFVQYVCNNGDGTGYVR